MWNSQKGYVPSVQHNQANLTEEKKDVVVVEFDEWKVL